MQHNQDSWIKQQIQQKKYIQPNQLQMMNPQNYYTNMPITTNRYMNGYHTVEQQPRWKYQQNQIQAQEFQKRNEYCLNKQYVNSNYYSEHQIMGNSHEV